MTVSDIESAASLNNHLPRPLYRHRRLLSYLGPLAIYGLMGLAANWPNWPGDPSRMRAGDLTIMMWWLEWTPYAIIHGHNPFFTSWMNYPLGSNLAGATNAPLLGLVMAPLTLLVSPESTLTFLQWAAFPLSGISMFFVVRRWGRGVAAAFVAGAIYAFSPYVSAQALGHMFAYFLPLPPLIFLCVVELFCVRKGNPRKWGLLLGGLVTGQYFISAEIDASTVIISVVGIAVLAISHPNEIVAAYKYARRGIAYGIALTVVFVAYPVAFDLFGPQHYSGAAQPGGVSNDLIAAFVPSDLQRLGPAAWRVSGTALLHGNLGENGAYIGIPLLVLASMTVIFLRRNRWVLFAAGMTLLSYIIALGPRLTVNNHVYNVPLPFAILARLPITDSLLAARFSQYEDFFLAVVIAFGVDAAVSLVRNRPRAMWRGEGPFVLSGKELRSLVISIVVRRVVGAFAVVSVLAVGFVTVASWWPEWPMYTSPIGMPAYFTTAAENRIPENSVVLISPYPSVYEILPQEWQALGGMRFKIIGGYGFFTTGQGTDSGFPAVLRPHDVEAFLNAQVSPSSYPDAVAPQETNFLVRQFRNFLIRYDVGTVLYLPVGGTPTQLAKVHSLFVRALGSPTAVVGPGQWPVNGPVQAWYDVAQLVARRGR